MPLSRSTLSPSGVVGPLAASTTYLQSSVAATSSVITSGIAAGISTSHDSDSSSSSGSRSPVSTTQIIALSHFLQKIVMKNFSCTADFAHMSLVTPGKALCFQFKAEGHSKAD